MAQLIRAEVRSEEAPRGQVYWLVAAIAASIGAFLLFPGDLALKAHLAMHGLCAQRPTHSMMLGGVPLPVDARMTGIYLGSATTLVWLACANRLRATGRVSVGVRCCLALFVITMTIDGLNALAADLHVGHPYEPSNELRLSSGILAGIALGVGLGCMLADTVWQGRERSRAIIGHSWELAIPIVVSALVGWIIQSGLAILYAPIAMGVVLCALAVVWLMIVIVVAAFCGRPGGARRNSDLAGIATLAWLAAVAIVGMLSVLRVVAETWGALPTMT